MKIRFLFWRLFPVFKIKLRYLKIYILRLPWNITYRIKTGTSLWNIPFSPGKPQDFQGFREAGPGTYFIFGRVRLGSIRNKNNGNDASKRLFGSYSRSGIPGFPFRLFCSQEQNSRNILRNILLFRNIPNERALKQLRWRRFYFFCFWKAIGKTEHNFITTFLLI